MNRALRALLTLAATGCGETSLGALRSSDAHVVDAPDALDVAPRRLPLRCGETFPTDTDAVMETSSEVRARLRDDRDLGVVERWEGGDSLLDGRDVTLLLPGGPCPGGTSMVGFRERPGTSDSASGNVCVRGLSAITRIELGYNNNFRGACVHGRQADVGRSYVLRLRSVYWQPDETIVLPPGEARCAFGVQFSNAVLAAPDGHRWSQRLGHEYELVGLPIGLDELDGLPSPSRISWGSSEHWGLWSTRDDRWFAERILFDGGTRSVQDLGDVLAERHAIDLLDTRAVEPGLLAIVRSPRGAPEVVGAVLMCPDAVPHVRRLVDGDASAARLILRGDRRVLVWQTDDPTGLSRLWVSEFDATYETRTPPQRVAEGIGVALVDVTATTSPTELVLWYARRQSDGTAMLRAGSLVFGF